MRPLLLLAPGAGAPSTSPWMESWARRLGALGEVVRFDYPYMEGGRGRPDPLPVLIRAHAAALARARSPGAPAFLVGKSMGSRVGCHLSLAEPVAGLVCLGYPLHGARGDLRDRVLVDLRTPILFVQGTRDRLCPLDSLEEVRRRMAAPSWLHVVEGGDHSLAVGVRTLRERRETQEEVDDRTLEAIRRFVTGQAGGAGERE